MHLCIALSLFPLMETVSESLSMAKRGDVRVCGVCFFLSRLPTWHAPSPTMKRE